ncbi:acetyltransferase [uncultured Bacteroides sp.]|uniref:acetyltransferase n=1 Tax=uncultured Bacteroides sp. TaxID=162156 RepID=UPI002AAB1B71|nr:acetyltransferase [uncultured Bacteroides sp.]
MKNLLIIGGRAFGREIYFLATQCKGYLVDYKVKGFLDDKSDALDGYKGYPPIISSVEDYEIQPDDVFVCALGDVLYKKHYAEVILAKGGEFISLIHPTVNIEQNVEIGKGCLIKMGVALSCDTKIGNFVTILPYTVVGHDSVVGDWCHLFTHTFIGGFCEIGSLVSLYTGAIILPYKKVGDNSIIGAGSVAVTNIKENVTAFGIPAKTLKF